MISFRIDRSHDLLGTSKGGKFQNSFILSFPFLTRAKIPAELIGEDFNTKDRNNV